MSKGIAKSPEKIAQEEHAACNQLLLALLVRWLKEKNHELKREVGATLKALGASQESIKSLWPHLFFKAAELFLTEEFPNYQKTEQEEKGTPE